MRHKVKELLQEVYAMNMDVQQVRKKGHNWRAWKHHGQGFLRGRCATGRGRPLGLAHHLSMERLRGKIKFGKWHRLMKRWSIFLRCCEIH